MDVKVTASAGSGGAIEWDINGKKPKNSELDFPRNSGPDTIKFTLFDRSGKNLRFDCNGPFWAHADDTQACPPEHSQCDQTNVIECTGKHLNVRNENSGEPCTIHYQLNFVDGSGNSVPVDPMIKNGGTGSV